MLNEPAALPLPEPVRAADDGAALQEEFERAQRVERMHTSGRRILHPPPNRILRKLFLQISLLIRLRLTKQAAEQRTGRRNTSSNNSRSNHDISSLARDR